MTLFALRGLLGRKLRAALTALAIVLGVAMICGTYVLTDSITQAFDAIFETTYQNTDAVVTGKRAFSGSNSGNAVNPSFDEALLPKVKALPDVRAAIGGVQGDAHLIDANGKAIAFGGAPNIGFSVDPSQPEFNSLKLTEGKWPGAEQLVVDTSTASKKNLSVGDKIGVQSRGPIVPMQISGIVKYGAVSSIGGATLAGFDLLTAQKLFDKQGQLDQIRVAAKSGVSPERLIKEVAAILPSDTQVKSGTAQASADAKDTTQFLSFLQKFLLAFGGVALFVGAFVIANSLSITIAQRTREFATLRTIGASRLQILRSVFIEALVLGVVASLVGLVLGLLLAKGLFRLFDLVGFTLPNNGLTLETRTIVVSLLVGIVVTLLASLRPALRATRVPPVAAVREGATLPPGRFHRLRPFGAAGVAILGFALLSFGLFGHGLGTTKVLLFMLFGALLVFFGVALFAAQLVRPLAHALGWPATRIGGAAGALARSNAQRNPQRTASTAAALMIGLALVTLVATLAAGIIKPFEDAVNQLFVADYAITAQNNFDPIPPAAAKAAATVPGVTAIASVRGGDGVIVTNGANGDVIQVTGVEPQTSQVIDLKWQQGSTSTIDNLGANGAVISKAYAKDHGLSVGSPIVVLTPTGEQLVLVVKGIYDPPTGGSPFGTVTISSEAFDSHWQQPLNLFTFVKMEGGVTAANTAALDAALKPFPNAKPQTRQQFKDNQINGFKQVLNILYVLLALSVLVSFFGIVNTLVLTVFERTRELGMLRAIGMTRRQVRRMIRHESIITALIGAALGIALGLALGGLLAYRVKEIVFAVPWQQLVIFTIAAIIVGIIAAIFPARRAAKLDPLRAIAYE